MVASYPAKALRAPAFLCITCMEISRLVNGKVCPSIMANLMRPPEPARNLQVSAADAGAGNVAIEQQAT